MSNVCGSPREPVSSRWAARPLLALLRPPAMSAFAPLFGDKRTSGAPNPSAPNYEYTASLTRFADPARDRLVDVVAQHPRWQESLVHELRGGTRHAGNILRLRDPLAGLEQAESCPGRRDTLAPVAHAVAVHVDELAAAVDRLQVDSVEGGKRRLLVGAPRGAVLSREDVAHAQGTSDFGEC